MLHFGALEAGGTKMVCAVGNAQGQILERISLPTRDPENTMPEILAFFREPVPAYILDPDKANLTEWKLDKGVNQVDLGAKPKGQE